MGRVAFALVFFGGGRPGGAAQAEQFAFVALGDTAYNGEADDKAYAALIERINQVRPAFTVHIGDVWGGSTCLEEDHRTILGWFARYEQPVVYTPGDNEWTDCVDPHVLEAYGRIEEGQALPGDMQAMAAFRQLTSRAARSGQWVLTSLERIRLLYFGTPHSLVQRKMPLVRHGAVSDPYAEFVENARWSQGGVLFATVHVVGSMNVLSIASAEAAAQAVRRNQANVARIQEAFAEAERTDAKAVVLTMHGSFFDKGPASGQGKARGVLGGRSGPYGLVATAIQDLSAAFDKRVLLIQGDDHEFMIDRPFLTQSETDHRPKGSNVTRLQVFGAPEIRAVRIGVDTATPRVFSFAPLHAD
jgi:hypothetical protein